MLIGTSPLSRLLLLVLSLSLSRIAHSAITDRFAPLCPNYPYSDPPPLGWKLWTDPTLWPNGVVPGVNSLAVNNVTIPCDQGVRLNVNITVKSLVVNGWLKVDLPGPFQVFADSVIVQGKLSIGTQSVPYNGKIVFNMTSGDEVFLTRSPYTVARSIGKAVFAVVGGQVDFNGMYGNNAGWTTLAPDANSGTQSILVKGDVSAWPVGGTVAISSTDFDRTQAERRQITGVVKGSTAGTTTLFLSSPLSYSHRGNPIRLPSSRSSAPQVLDQAAEVALLTRSVVIQGHPNAVDPLIGGHFIVVQSYLPQQITGVEYVNMGQQGTLGKYPVHFHLCADVSNSFVRKCAVHDSNQRCYVIHGTWSLLLDGNVGVDTKGHCFMLEDGIEFNNTINGNLGFGQEPPMRTIVNNDPVPAVESDNSPSTFWITNPNNTFTNNVAGGSFDSGWWFELQAQVLGPSSNFPNAAGVQPKFIPLRSFVNNSAHSNGRAGLRTYPGGYRPRQYGGISPNQATAGINAPAANISFINFRAYKNQFIGLFIHETDSVQIQGAQVSDNAVVGIEFNKAQANVISNSVILGESPNVGNPHGCSDTSNDYASCAPTIASGLCSLPIADPASVRSHSNTVKLTWPTFGVLIDQDDYPSHGYGVGAIPNHIYNVTFGMFNSTCRTMAAITANGKEGAIWTAAHSSHGLQFLDNSPRLWFVPESLGQLGFEAQQGAGPEANVYVWRDEDGSVVGGSGGYAVTGLNPGLLPPNASTACIAQPTWNGMACPGTCYRTLGIAVSGPGALQAYIFTRVEDGVSFSMPATGGLTFINLLSNTPYNVSFNPPTFVPDTLTVQYGDGNQGCQQGLILQFLNPSGNVTWVIKPTTYLFWQPCTKSSINSSAISTAMWVCPSSSLSSPALPSLQIKMAPLTSGGIVLNSMAGQIDCSSKICGLLPPGASWSYDDLKDNAPGFLSAKWILPPSQRTSWKAGVAPFGFGFNNMYASTVIAPTSQNGMSWFFRAPFSMAYAGCFSQLLIGTAAKDGFVVFVNGKEAYRSDVPPVGTPLTQSTAATADPGSPSGWTVTSLKLSNIWLQSGNNANVIQVRLLAAQPWQWFITFDAWVAAVSTACPAKFVYSATS